VFRLSRNTLGELGLLIFLLHQPGEHMCLLRRTKRLLFLSAQGASDNMKGGLIVMWESAFWCTTTATHLRCNVMASCVTADFGAFTFHLPGWHMEMNGVDDISRGKAEKMHLMGSVGLNATANPVLNPFSQQNWGLPGHIRTLIEEQFGREVMYFACGNGLTAARCANAAGCAYTLLLRLWCSCWTWHMRCWMCVPLHDGADYLWCA
jgi:hypothetical protein